MKPKAPDTQSIPLKIVGGNKFGIYPKISQESTFNMFVSDGWLVSFSGYKKIATINTNGIGRAIYSSTRADLMFAVVDNIFLSISPNLTVTQIGFIDTFVGDVFIAENNNNQIAICDKTNIYVYNWLTGGGLVKATGGSSGTDPLDFIPGYIAYHDTYIIAADISQAGNPAQWRLSVSGDATQFPADAQHTGTMQTKPDYVVGVVYIPSAANNILVMGKTVAEPWQNVGAQLFPYQRNSTQNLDYGCLSADTIAYGDNIVAFLGTNEKSGPAIMYTTGGDIQQVSTDGINYKLDQLVNPSNSYAFFYKQLGHLFYVITFADPQDNLTLMYDFNLQTFYYLTDELMNIFIAKRVCNFNDRFYFVSSVDGDIYELDQAFYTYDYGNGKVEEIPCVRVCENVRLPDSSRFVCNNITFTMEQGTDPNAPQDIPEYLATENGVFLQTEDMKYYIGLENVNLLPQYQPRIDFSVSRDGGENFGSSVSKYLNPLGYRRNRVIFWNVGAANDLVPQFRFWSTWRKAITNGEVNIFQ